MEGLVPSGSGTGPERALEAITLIPRAQRESPASPELPCERSARSRGAPTRSPPPSPDLQHHPTPHTHPDRLDDPL